MKTGVYANAEKAENGANAQKFVVFLEKNGFSASEIDVNDENALSGTDVLFVLGGDGTILRCAEKCARFGVKIVGVNYGTLGFLAEFEKDETEKIPAFLNDLERGKIAEAKRSLLKITCKEGTFFALNEAALRRDYNVKDGRMLKVQTNVNGCDFDEFSGDGILVCTPTGSTAYSLSAGGPIIVPQTPAILLTPLCAFSLAARPVVFPSDDTISVSITRGDAFLLIDGEVRAHVKEGGFIRAETADLSAVFPTRSYSSFYAKVRRKLG